MTGPWAEALVGSGFSPGEVSGWLLEGFLFYIANDTAERILDEVTRLSAPGSWLGLDIVNGAMLDSPLTRAWVQMQADSGAPWIGTMDDPVGELATRGWRAHLSQAGAADAHHGRWPFPVVPVDMPDFPHNWFVTARRE